MVEIRSFANEVLAQALKSLGMEFNYFSYPLGVMNFTLSEEVETVAVASGKGLVNPLYLVTATASGGINKTKANILHCLLHCLFGHPFKNLDGARNDLAKDITVSYILDELGYPCGEKSLISKRKSVYKSIIDEFSSVNDQNSAKFCNGLTDSEVEVYQSYFIVCEHSHWKSNEDFESQSQEQTVALLSDSQSDNERESLEIMWRMIANNLLPQIGKLNPSLKRILSLAVGKSGGYKAFLKYFLRLRERIKPSDEEFDYIYYCLGLNNYGNVPLIENLEYSDRRDYSDIVIAVDTSGSTDGEPIKILLKEVFSLIKSMETGGEKYRVRIIQCDLKIQREDIVESLEEFSNMLSNYELQGGGGTDFTPVFDYLTTLKRKGEKIEGLIYFTDGVGVYPREIPPFKTCFAILGDEQVNVPHFAYKINVEN